MEPLRIYVIFKDSLGWHVERCSSQLAAVQFKYPLERRGLHAFIVQAADDEQLAARYWQAATGSWAGSALE